MEAAGLILPDFWESDTPVMLTGAGEPPLAAPPIPEVSGPIFFSTSGSTGVPKWIGHTRASLLASATAVNAHLHVDSGSCWGLALPIHHVGGFGVMARSYLARCKAAIYPHRWDAALFSNWLSRENITHLSLVPTQVHDLVAAACRAPSSLRAVVVGGGVLPLATGRAARDLGWPVLASYGMTETASQIATRRIELLDLPYDTAPIDLIDPWAVESGIDGRLQVRGPSLFSGILSCDDGEWIYAPRRSDTFVTSDLALVNGRELTILGRADSIVKILGELVDPISVEAEILSLSGAAPGTLAVVAQDDPRAGKALVLLHEPSLAPAAMAAVIAEYHATCPGFRRISRVIEIQEIPRSPLGKIRRAGLLNHLR
jgi:O-succinylbenzoic acid--CoA ligase